MACRCLAVVRSCTNIGVMRVARGGLHGWVSTSSPHRSDGNDGGVIRRGAKRADEEIVLI